MRTAVIGLVLALGACNHAVTDIGTAGQNPGMIVCGGKGNIYLTGAALMYSAAGSIGFDCAQGAYFGQGYPMSGSPPNVPSAGTPKVALPPIGPPPGPTAPTTGASQ